MVVPSPVPLELQGRPFVEQARALPARVALEAFFAAAAGFMDDSPATGLKNSTPGSSSAQSNQLCLNSS